MWNNTRFSTTMKSTPGDKVYKRDDLFTGNALSWTNRGIIPIKPNTSGDYDENTYAKLRELYGGYEIEGPILTSKYKPTNSKNSNTTYYSVTSEKTVPFLVDLANHIETNKDDLEKGYLNLYKSFGDYAYEKALKNVDNTKNTGPIRKTRDAKGNVIPNTYNVPRYFKTSNDYNIRGLGELGNYQVSFGEDERGEYIAYYDLWDTTNPAEFLGGSKPLGVYDRIYLKDYGDGKQKRMYYSDKELSELDIDKKDFDTLALQRELSNRGYKLHKSTKQDGSLDGTLGDETKNALLN